MYKIGENSTFICLFRNEFFGVKALPAIRFITADTREVVTYELGLPDQVVREVTNAGQEGMADMTPATDSWLQSEFPRMMKYLRDHDWMSDN